MSSKGGHGKGIDFEQRAKAIREEAPKIQDTIEDVLKSFEDLYHSTRKDVHGTKPGAKGVPVPDIKGIDDESRVEELADQFGILFGEAHYKALVARIKDLKHSIASGHFDHEKTEKDVKYELTLARQELQQLGYNWEAIKEHIGQKGLDDQLLATLKDNYRQGATAYEARKHIHDLKPKNRKSLIEHLVHADSNLDEEKLQREEFDYLKQLFVQYHSLASQEAKEREKKKTLRDAFGHLYKGADEHGGNAHHMKDYKHGKKEYHKAA